MESDNQFPRESGVLVSLFHEVMEGEGVPYGPAPRPARGPGFGNQDNRGQGAGAPAPRPLQPQQTRGYARFPHMHLPVFEGDPRRLREFRKTLEVAFAASPGMSEVEMMALVVGLFSGDAKGWWLGKSDNFRPETWQELLGELQSELMRGTKYALWAELHHRTLKAGETLSSYKYDIANLCEMLGIEADEEVGCFVRGLPDNIRSVVSAQDPMDVDEAYKIAKRVMEYAMPTPLREISASQYPPLFEGRQKEEPWRNRGDMYPKETGVSAKEIADLTQQLGKITLHLLKEKEQKEHYPGPRGGAEGRTNFICGKCLQAGHMQRNCSNPPNPAAVRCANCSFYGHKESECRRGKREIRTVTSHMTMVGGQGESSEEYVYDQGHEGPHPFSGFVGLTLDGDYDFPPCQISYEDEPLSANLQVHKKVSFEVPEEGDADDESSFEVTSTEEEEEAGLGHLQSFGTDRPEVITIDSGIRRGAAKKARTREEVEIEEQQGRKEGRRVQREEKRKSNYKLMDVLLGPQVPLLTEVMPKLPYARKDAHDWLDKKVLKYESRSRVAKMSTGTLKDEGEKQTYGTWTYTTDHPRKHTEKGQLRYISVRIGDRTIPAIIDTGSQISVISYGLLRELGMEHKLCTRNTLTFTGTDQHSHSAKGTVELSMYLGKMRVNTIFTCVEGPSSSFQILIGQDVLGPTYATCCNEAREVRFKVPNGGYVHCPFINPKN